MRNHERPAQSEHGGRSEPALETMIRLGAALRVPAARMVAAVEGAWGWTARALSARAGAGSPTWRVHVIGERQGRPRWERLGPRAARGPAGDSAVVRGLASARSTQLA